MKRELIVFFSVLLITGVVAVTSLVPWPIIKINHIECKLDNNSCSNELIDKLSLLRDKSFLFTNIENQILNLNLDFYQLKNIKKTWPDKIELLFSSKDSSYILKLEPSQQINLVAENGLIYPEKNNDSVVQITLKNWPEAITENKINQTLHGLITSLIRQLNEYDIKINEIIIHDHNHIEIILNNKLIVLAQESQLDQQIAKLAVILEKLNFSEIDLDIKEIDLRFKFPVLRTNLSPSS
ncbi:hypothetical protein KKE34_03015 [Patescibacteria group bacterium]|nr:hypothetical protein [Patescibacteria group bacterium]MBU1885558.1 hypothetical protein [Patescibacteria group bacterium]